MHIFTHSTDVSLEVLDNQECKIMRMSFFITIRSI